MNKEEKAEYSAKHYRKNKEKRHRQLQEWTHKGGKYYERKLKYDQTGLRCERNLVRNKHQKHYRSFKQIIAPESQLHHQWIIDTANYRGVALVEADQHMHGSIDVIQILEGEITLLTEAEIRGEN